MPWRSSYNRRILAARVAGLTITGTSVARIRDDLEEYLGYMVAALRKGSATDAQIRAIPQINQIVRSLNATLRARVDRTVHLSADAAAQIHAEATLKAISDAGVDLPRSGVTNVFGGANIQAAQAVLARGRYADTFRSLRAHTSREVEQILLRSALRNELPGVTEKRLRTYMLGADEIPPKLLHDRRLISKRTLAEYYGIENPTSADVADVRRQAGKVVERSTLIARTEAANAEWEAKALANERSPVVAGIKWNLSQRHGKRDECDWLATTDAHGMGPGVWPHDAIPSRPHPRCLCYQTHELRPVEDWGKRKKSGPPLQINVDRSTRKFGLSRSRRKAVKTSVATAQVRSARRRAEIARPAVTALQRAERLYGTYKVGQFVGDQIRRHYGIQTLVRQGLSLDDAVRAIEAAEASRRAAERFRRQAARRARAGRPEPDDAVRVGLLSASAGPSHDDYLVRFGPQQPPRDFPVGSLRNWRELADSPVDLTPANRAEIFEHNYGVIRAWLSDQDREHQFIVDTKGDILDYQPGYATYVKTPPDVLRRAARSHAWLIHNHPIASLDGQRDSFFDMPFSVGDLKVAKDVGLGGIAAIGRRYEYRLSPRFAGRYTRWSEDSWSYPAGIDYEGGRFVSESALYDHLYRTARREISRTRRLVDTNIEDYRALLAHWEEHTRPYIGRPVSEWGETLRTEGLLAGVIDEAGEIIDRPALEYMVRKPIYHLEAESLARHRSLAAYANAVGDVYYRREWNPDVASWLRPHRAGPGEWQRHLPDGFDDLPYGDPARTAAWEAAQAEARASVARLRAALGVPLRGFDPIGKIDPTWTLALRVGVENTLGPNGQRRSGLVSAWRAEKWLSQTKVTAGPKSISEFPRFVDPPAGQTTRQNFVLAAEWLRDEWHESAFAFDQRGRVIFFRQGDTDSVSFRRDDYLSTRAIRGTLTHNHSFTGEVGTPKYYANIGFSPADVKALVIGEWGEIQVVTGRYVYYLRKGKSWDDSYGILRWPQRTRRWQWPMRDTLEKIRREEIDRALERYAIYESWDEVKEAVASGVPRSRAITVGKADEIVRHETMRRFADQFDLEYGRLKFDPPLGDELPRRLPMSEADAISLAQGRLVPGASTGGSASTVWNLNAGISLARRWDGKGRRRRIRQQQLEDSNLPRSVEKRRGDEVPIPGLASHHIDLEEAIESYNRAFRPAIEELLENWDDYKYELARVGAGSQYTPDELRSYLEDVLDAIDSDDLARQLAHHAGDVQHIVRPMVKRLVQAKGGKRLIDRILHGDAPDLDEIAEELAKKYAPDVDVDTDKLAKAVFVHHKGDPTPGDGSSTTRFATNVADQREGYSVAIAGDRTRVLKPSEFTVEAIREYIEQNKFLWKKYPEAGVGTWRNPKTGNIELDMIRVYDDLAEAKAAGIARKQEAIFDLKNLVDIPLDARDVPPQRLARRATPAHRPDVLTSAGVTRKARIQSRLNDSTGDIADATEEGWSRVRDLPDLKTPDGETVYDANSMLPVIDVQRLGDPDLTPTSRLKDAYTKLANLITEDDRVPSGLRLIRDQLETARQRLGLPAPTIADQTRERIAAQYFGPQLDRIRVQALERTTEVASRVWQSYADDGPLTDLINAFGRLEATGSYRGIKNPYLRSLHGNALDGYAEGLRRALQDVDKLARLGKAGHPSPVYISTLTRTGELEAHPSLIRLLAFLDDDIEIQRFEAGAVERLRPNALEESLMDVVREAVPDARVRRQLLDDLSELGYRMHSVDELIEDMDIAFWDGVPSNKALSNTLNRIAVHNTGPRRLRIAEVDYLFDPANHMREFVDTVAAAEELYGGIVNAWAGSSTGNQSAIVVQLLARKEFDLRNPAVKHMAQDVPYAGTYQRPIRDVVEKLEQQVRSSRAALRNIAVTREEWLARSSTTGVVRRWKQHVATSGNFFQIIDDVTGEVGDLIEGDALAAAMTDFDWDQIERFVRATDPDAVRLELADQISALDQRIAAIAAKENVRIARRDNHSIEALTGDVSEELWELAVERNKVDAIRQATYAYENYQKYYQTNRASVQRAIGQAQARLRELADKFGTLKPTPATYTIEELDAEDRFVRRLLELVGDVDQINIPADPNRLVGTAVHDRLNDLLDHALDAAAELSSVVRDGWVDDVLRAGEAKIVEQRLRLRRAAFKVKVDEALKDYAEHLAASLPADEARQRVEDIVEAFKFRFDLAERVEPNVNANLAHSFLTARSLKNDLDEAVRRVEEALTEDLLGKYDFPENVLVLDKPELEQAIKGAAQRSQQTFEAALRQAEDPAVEAYVRHVLRAMYDITQEELAQQGVEYVTVYRGFGMLRDVAERVLSETGDFVRVRMQPISSVTTSPQVALHFQNHISVERRGALSAMRIPRRKVLACAATGQGCLEEAEFTILGGDDLVSWTVLQPEYRVVRSSGQVFGEFQEYGNVKTSFFQWLNHAFRQGLVRNDHIDLHESVLLRTFDDHPRAIQELTGGEKLPWIPRNWEAFAERPALAQRYTHIFDESIAHQIVGRHIRSRYVLAGRSEVAAMGLDEGALHTLIDKYGLRRPPDDPTFEDLENLFGWVAHELTQLWRKGGLPFTADLLPRG